MWELIRASFELFVVCFIVAYDVIRHGESNIFVRLWLALMLVLISPASFVFLSWVTTQVQMISYEEVGFDWVNR